MISDNITITGDMSIVVYGPDGQVNDWREIKNMVVTTGKNQIAALLTGSTVKPSHIGLGTDSTPTTAASEALGAETVSRVAFNTNTVDANVATYTASINPGVGTGTFSEAGIFSASTAGVMLARTTFNTITKTSVDKLVITWNIRVN